MTLKREDLIGPAEAITAAMVPGLARFAMTPKKAAELFYPVLQALEDEQPKREPMSISEEALTKSELGQRDEVQALA